MNWPGWTDENVTALRTRFANGESASQIARAIRAPSRNVVIGKLHRMGIVRTPIGRAASMAMGKSNRAGPAPCAAKTLPMTSAADGSAHQPGAIRVGSNGVRTYVQPTPAPLPRRPASLAALNETSLRVRSIDLQFRGQCKFGTHEDAGGHLFCGHETKAESVYCDGHHKVAYPPAPKKPPKSIRPDLKPGQTAGRGHSLQRRYVA